MLQNGKNVIIPVSHLSQEIFLQEIDKFGINVIQVSEPNMWMDNIGITDQEDKKTLQELIDLTGHNSDMILVGVDQL